MPKDLSRHTIHLVGHAHIDLGYRWRWNETVHRIGRDTFRGVLRMMDQVPELIFVQSQPAIYEAMKQHYPEIFEEIVARIAEGRWIVADGWCEYDHTMPSGEAMIRQHLIGSRYAQEELGCEITLDWAPDAFSGHVHTLPTILRGCGIDCLLFGRGMPENLPVFWWEGPDGARVLSYTPVFAYSSQIGPKLLDQLEQWAEMTGTKEMLVLYGRGDHGGGPRKEDIEELQRMRAEDGCPRMVHTHPREFFDQVLAPRPNVPLYRGELGGGFTGSCSSEGRIKQRNRQVVNLLLTAERFASIATYFQRKPVYPRVDMKEAWKTVLRHQFHDELPGTSRAPVFEDNAADYDRIEAQAQGILDTALAEIGARMDTRGPGTPIPVFNPLAWARTEPVQVTLRLNQEPGELVVRDAAGVPTPAQVLSVSEHGHFWRAEVLFVAQDVPPLGLKLYRAFEVNSRGESLEVPPELQVEALTLKNALENAFLRVRIDAQTGQVTSINDKQRGIEVLDGPGNVLQAIAEKPGEASAWILALIDKIDELAEPESIQIVERGPVRATLRVSYRYRDSFFVQDVILYAGLPKVDFRLRADWYERDCCLKVAFPVAAPEGRATFEVPYGTIERLADGAEVPAQRWIDVSNEAGGASLLNDCRYAFDVRENVMRMTLLRGIPDLDPRADEGAHDLRYALYPHSGDWRAGKCVRRGWEINFPLLGRQELRRAGMIRPWTSSAVYHSMPPEFGFLQLEADNVVLSALKVEEEDWGEWSKIVIRLYETEGRVTEAKLTFAAPLRLCEETNHLEEPVEGSDVTHQEDTVWVHLRPHEIKTLRVSLAVPNFALYEGEHRDDVKPGHPPRLEGG